MQLDEEAGLVLVRVEYRIARDNTAEFQRVMQDVRRVRRRDNATRRDPY